MNSDTLTLYKLIILYVLDKVDFPLSNAQITEFILEKEYTNYFSIQKALSELVDADLLVHETIRNRTIYQITSSGKETLSYFNHMISDAIKADIIYYLNENKYKLREEIATSADYFETNKNEFVARCRVIENKSPIIELSLSVPTKEEAETICKNWKTKSQKIYSDVIASLLSDK